MKVNWGWIAVILLVLVVVVGGIFLYYKPFDHSINVDLVEGKPFVAGDLAIRSSDECDALPILIDHSGEEQLPDGFPVDALRNGDYATVAEFMGVKVSDVYGCQRAKAGELYVDAKYAEFRCGPATMIAHVQDEMGNPLPNILLANHWPDMGDANQFDQAPGGVDPLYEATGTLAFTNGDGNVGYGLGAGSYLTPHVGGPHTVWSISGTGAVGEIVGSDAFKNIGMLPMSNHCILNPWFEITTKDGVVPAAGKERIAIYHNGIIIGFVYPSEEPPPQGFNGLELQSEEGEPVWTVPAELP